MCEIYYLYRGFWVLFGLCLVCIFCFCWFDCLWFLFRRLGVILFFCLFRVERVGCGDLFFLFLFNWFFLWGSFLGFCFLLGWDFVYFCCLFLLLLLVWIGTWSVLYFYFGGIRDTCVFCFYFVFRGNLDQIFGWDVVLGDGEQVCFLFFGVNKLTLGNFMKPY